MKELSFETLEGNLKMTRSEFGSLIEDAQKEMEQHPDEVTIVGKEIDILIIRRDAPNISKRAEMVVAFNKFIGLSFIPEESEDDEPTTVAINVVELYDLIRRHMPRPDLLDYSKVSKIKFVYNSDTELYRLVQLVFSIKLHDDTEEMTD